VDDETLVLRLMLTAGLSVAGVGALVSLALFAASRGHRPVRPFAPPVGRPWSGLAVLAAFLVIPLTIVCDSVVDGLLRAGGFFQALYGPNFPVGLTPDPTPAEKAAATVRYLWVHTLTFPLVVAAIAWLPRALKVVNPFSARGWADAAVAGYLTWLIVTPAAFCVFILANLGHMKLTGRGPEKHPLTALTDAAGPLEWGLLILQTVVIAPVLEEWLFRGVLLPWLAQKRAADPEGPLTVPPGRRPVLVLVAAVAATDPPAAVASYLIPPAFFLLLIPLDFVVTSHDRLRRHLRVRSRQHARAILASAALFAAFHAHVWPSPVPLVVLAVGLGYLYVRTRSLVGPVVVHGMFNAVSAVYLLLGGPA
jgi:membrane protease YdiL (CAAX protease family)